MTVFSMLFLLLAGTALQALLPAFGWAGYSTMPVLASIVVYFSLYRGNAIMLIVALLAGLFQDSLSLMPIGYSSFCFAGGALVILKFREMMVINSVLTHMVLAAALHAAVTAFLIIMLLKEGMIPWHPFWLFLKIPGALLLGVFTGPLVIAVAQALEEKLGLIQGMNDRYGSHRSYYGIG